MAILAKCETCNGNGEFLSIERETFEAELHGLLLGHRGMYAFVVGREVHGPYKTESDADEAGREHTGNGSFLIDRILPIEDRAHSCGLVFS